MNTILSLCDHSGKWSEPYSRAGYNVVKVDLKAGQDVRLFQHIGQPVHGILMAPPCTAFTVSGAQYWPTKDASGETLEALAIVDACLRAVAIYQPAWWVLENPVGRLRRYIGEPKHSFDPCDYAAHLCELACWSQLPAIRARAEAGEKLTKAQVQIVKDCNVYTKNTQLFGQFTPPMLARVEPIRTSTQGSWTQLLGGKSERTKELRSETPAGFAEAFFRANL